LLFHPAKTFQPLAQVPVGSMEYFHSSYVLKIKDNDFTIASPASRGRITPYTIFSFTKRNELPALIPELFQSAKV